ncbi:hypothetical protein [Streptomyces agglomeratus]|nr:hypothetical protein [Streptomyces agglomeratus]
MVQLFAACGIGEEADAGPLLERGGVADEVEIADLDTSCVVDGDS